MSEQMKIEFVKPGMLTTVQDLGRPNFREFGIPHGGVLDKRSAEKANWLVGNKKEVPVFEITLLGPEILFDDECQIAITGADISPHINGGDVPMYETVSVERGAVLKFGKLKNGCRTYLAIGGEWKVAEWLGSSSALPFSGLNILPKNKIKKGTEFIFGKKEWIAKRETPKEERPGFSSFNKIAVLPGPEFELFPRQYIAQFFSTTFKISPHSNRMGIRLESETIKFSPKKELISSGTIPGTIQITNGGQPILLLADAQTTGGYYRLAKVVESDMDVLAQMKPGEEIRFYLKI